MLVRYQAALMPDRDRISASVTIGTAASQFNPAAVYEIVIAA